MIGTMYQPHALPKSYGASYSKARGSGPGVTQVALVVLLVLSGGLGLMHLSSRSQVRDLKIHHEALQEELTYTKNHLHHVEAQLANKETEYNHLAQEVHQYSAHHSIQELETLRTQKRVSDTSLAAAQEEAKKYKEELEAAHALIDAYKHHLSDEVASHHQREETWMAVQTEWEKLEQELNAEIDSLRNQLNSAHIKINDAAHHTHAHPQHVQAEAQKHDPLLDNLPPANTQPQQHVAGSPAPAAAAVPAPAPAQQQHAAPVPVHTPATPAPTQQHTQAHDAHAQHQQVPVPVPTMPAPADASTPPHPAEAPHAHHNDHYQHHDGTTHGDWQHTEYDNNWDAHNLYADYPGFVDEHQQQHTGDAAHNTWDHHGDSHNLHADNGQHIYDHAQHPSPHAQHHAQQHVPLPADTPATTHDAHAAHQHAAAGHTGHADPHAAHTQAQQQQHQGHTDPHAAHTQAQQQQHQAHQDAHQQQQQQQHHVVDDLAMKLGLGGHQEAHQPEQQWHH